MGPDDVYMCRACDMSMGLGTLVADHGRITWRILHSPAVASW